MVLFLLKEIKGDKKYFTIKLHNTSNRPLTFKVSASAITTDALTDRLKLDETYKDEKSPDGSKLFQKSTQKKSKEQILHLSMTLSL